MRVVFLHMKKHVYFNAESQRICDLPSVSSSGDSFYNTLCPLRLCVKANHFGWIAAYTEKDNV